MYLDIQRVLYTLIDIDLDTIYIPGYTESIYLFILFIRTQL